jgi:hypothetical protein
MSSCPVHVRSCYRARDDLLADGVDTAKKFGSDWLSATNTRKYVGVDFR